MCLSLQSCLHCFTLKNIMNIFTTVIACQAFLKCLMLMGTDFLYEAGPCNLHFENKGWGDRNREVGESPARGAGSTVPAPSHPISLPLVRVDYWEQSRNYFSSMLP